MKKVFIPLLLISLVVVASGCTSQTPTCNPPYTLKGTECCLDQNGNSICDTDEQQISDNQETGTCGDGDCQSDENCSSCPQDCGECQTPRPDLVISDWNIISGWEELIVENEKNNFSVLPGSDALFVSTITNYGDASVNDLVENIACNIRSGDYDILNKINYHGFQCQDSKCSYIETESILDNKGTIGKKVKLFPNGQTILSLRFIDENAEPLVSEYTIVTCSVNVFSEENPEISSNNNIEIHFIAD